MVGEKYKMLRMHKKGRLENVMAFLLWSNVARYGNILDDKGLTVWCWYTFGLLYFIADHPSPLFQKQTVEALFIQGGSKQDLLIWHLFARGHFIHHLIYAEMLEEALG